MRKLISIVALVMITQLSFGQHTMNQLFKKFGQNKEVTRIKIGSMMMGFAGLFAETMGVKGVEVLAFENCSEATKEELKNDLRNLKDPSFETMVSTNENGKRTRVMVKIKNDTIKELVVLTTDEGGALVRIRGDIKRSDIEKVIKEHSNG